MQRHISFFLTLTLTLTLSLRTNWVLEAIDADLDPSRTPLITRSHILYFHIPQKNDDMFRRIVFSSPGNEDDFIPSTVEEIFTDYEGRRLGFLRAFFRDVDKFYSSCDPEKINLSLYAHPDGSWEVDEPPLELTTNLPEPVIGINYARNGMQRKYWLGLVSAHSDCWLLSLASFFSAPLSRDERIRLFNLINDLPTLFEEVIKQHHL